jgi:hypothetical protein
MSLINLVDNSLTDKNTHHSYLETYDKLFSSKKLSAQKVMEIGIAHGGSIKLWRDYFINAEIYGLDIMTKDTIKNLHVVLSNLFELDRVQLFTGIDAYNSNFYNMFLEKNIKFDIIVDDGPHTIESLKIFIKNYSKMLSENGILVIEDVQSIDWYSILKEELPEDLQRNLKLYDLRNIKNKYDDILIVLEKED